MKRRDIRLASKEEKVKLYEELEGLRLKGEKLLIKEHHSGFPAVTVDCGHIHILTDILSVEEWWRQCQKS